MFWRILWRLLYASRSRLALALLAVASGAAVCAALVNLDLDAGDKLTREFRSLGANVVVSPEQGGGNVSGTMDASVMQKIGALQISGLFAGSPYLYVVAQAGEGPNAVPVIVAGAWPYQVARMDSWWKVDGEWMTSRDDRAHCMVGQQAAQALGVGLGDRVHVHYASRDASLTVAGIVTAGGSQDSQLFVALAVAQDLAGQEARIGLAQLSVRGTPPEIENVMRQLSSALPGTEVQPVRRLAAAEGRLLERIHGLLFVTIALILVLSALGVLAAMAGLAMERRRDVGLMKALGGSVRRVMRFFLAEATAIGAVGGMVGCGVGMLIAEWIGERVFGASITPRLVVMPVTVGLMILVALAGAMPLRLLGRVRPGEILRGE
jgi:putative ABC transport system permease protein